MMTISFCFFIYFLVLRIDFLQAQETLPCNCDNVQCENITCPEDQVEFKPDNSNGLCECCSGCIRYKKMGERNCRTYADPVRTSACSRFYTSNNCDVGLTCEFNQTILTSACILDIDPVCFSARLGYKNEINADWYLPIDCAKDGTYMPKQCKQNNCFCVDEDGNRIFGDFTKEEAKITNCACSLMEIHLAKASEKSTGDFDHVVCQKNGNFHTLQCLRETCFCVNETTGELTSPIVPKPVVDQLPCYDKVSYQSLFNSPCQIQREYEERLASYYIKHQNVKHEYLTITKCNPDATYVVKQCTPESCFCANPITGLSAGNYYVTYRSPLEKKMNCQCALDMVKASAEGGSLQTFDCAENGNYKKFSCQGFLCYCVDADGFRDSEVLDLTPWADNFCNIDSKHKRIRDCYLESYNCDDENEDNKNKQVTSE